MKSYCVFLFTILLSAQVFSQDYSCYLNILSNKDIDKNYRLIYSDFNNSFSSDAIPITFINSFSRGEHISKDKINNTISSLNNTNIVGIDASYGVSFVSFINSKRENTKRAITGGVYYNNSIDSEFNKNVFQFIFQGNSDFLGKTINLNQTNLNYSEFGIIKLGFLRLTEENSTKQIIHTSFSALGGFNHIKGIVNNAELETHELGEHINFDLEISANTSDLITDRQEIRGLGGAIDFFGAHQTEKGTVYFASLKNLGMIKWNKNPHNLNLDTTFKYDGIEIANLSFNSDTTLGNLNIDSLKSDYLKEVNNQTVYLPALIHVGYKKIIKGHDLVLGFKSRIKSNYTPMVYAKPMFNLKSINTFIGPIISYGGYDKFSYGAEISSKFKHDIYLSLRSFHIEGFITPENGTSKSVFITLSKGFSKKEKKLEN